MGGSIDRIANCLVNAVSDGCLRQGGDIDEFVADVGCGSCYWAAYGGASIVKLDRIAGDCACTNQTDVHGWGRIVGYAIADRSLDATEIIKDRKSRGRAKTVYANDIG